MSIENRKNNSVSFNLLDDFELKLLEHAEKVNPRTNRKRNFSKYVKHLIYQDLLKDQQLEVTTNNDNVEINVNYPPLVIKSTVEPTEDVVLPDKNDKVNPNHEQLNTFL